MKTLLKTCVTAVALATAGLAYAQTQDPADTTTPPTATTPSTTPSATTPSSTPSATTPSTSGDATRSTTSGTATDDTADDGTLEPRSDRN